MLFPCVDRVRDLHFWDDAWKGKKLSVTLWYEKSKSVD